MGEMDSLQSGAKPPLALFVCRDNTALSIMAEAILRHLEQQRVRAASAGNSHCGQVNPYALECLRSHGVETSKLSAKVWGQFFGADKPPVRFLIMLSESYAARANWPAETIIARWRMPDPADIVGHGSDIQLGFEEAFGTLESRIRKFLVLALTNVTDLELAQGLARIGEES
jgi:arsenate reductase